MDEAIAILHVRPKRAVRMSTTCTKTDLTAAQMEWGGEVFRIQTFGTKVQVHQLDEDRWVEVE